ncbi:hypothetical protein VKT23_014573 [Stygiomarasmius scandens]|uniref:Uncharacterized protein n=1 Tax=Marasmiellus scandens TaxID=2682957 RepID=A0ABR1J1M4_9AGAR
MTLGEWTSIPPPQPSPAPGQRRQDVPPPLTKKRIIQERVARWKKTRAAAPKPEGGIQIRGRWVSTPTRRQADTGVGSAFDGSQGVDSEDIVSIPQIGFSTFQLFLIKILTELSIPVFPALTRPLKIGNQWIQPTCSERLRFGKPVALTGFGLVSNDNLPFFVPSTLLPPHLQTLQPAASFGTAPQSSSQAIGVSNEQQVDAYNQWVNTGIVNGLQGMMQYNGVNLV